MSTPERRLNVLFITPWYPTADNVYFGVFVREYALAVQKFCNVVVLNIGVPDPRLKTAWSVQEETDTELTAGIPCYRACFRGKESSPLSLPARTAGIARAVATASKKHGSFDLLHAHVFTSGLFALAIARWLNIPLTISEHFSIIPGKQLTSFQARLMRGVFRRADAVLPVSRTMQTAIEDFGVRASFRIVPNTVRTDQFYYEPQNRACRDKVRLLAVNSLVELKGVSVLLKALAELPKTYRWHLDLVGDGPDRDQTKTLVDQMGLGTSVTFHGALRKSDVAHRMRNADLFVLPSLSETFSVATAEALCAGVPVLVTRCGGPEEFVDEQCGMLVPPGDVRALADGLISMLNRLNTFDREEISRVAVAKFRHEAVGSKLDGLYHELIATRARTRRGLNRISSLHNHRSWIFGRHFQ